jgi:hypothetical protein
MKIKMNKTTPGSVDGAFVMQYEAGKTYDLSGTPGERDLAKSFVESERAKQIGPDDKEDDEQVDLVAPGAGPTNIAPPDQISTNVHPADIEVNPERAVQPVAAPEQLTPMPEAKASSGKAAAKAHK